MISEGGIGIAAVQVGVLKNIFIVDIDWPNNKLNPHYIINPEIVYSEGSQTNMEGCLSFKGFKKSVTRAAKVKINYQDAYGKHKQLDAEGLLACAIQHEFDHLQAKTIKD